MQYQNKKARDRPYYIAMVIGYGIVAYVSIALTPYVQDGLIELWKRWEEISFSPTALSWTEDTPKTLLVCLLIYTLIALVLLTSKKRYHRQGVENGSSDYADIKKIRKEFNSSSPHRILYTQNFAISFAEKDTYRHKRNFNTLIVGGPGSGKTRGYVYPNLLEKTASYVVLDPKGEICRNTAKPMLEAGYKVKVLNLIDPYRSWGYNPFHYIHTDNRDDDDVQRIVTAIFKATTVPNSQSTDPFWDEAGKMLLSALMYLLYYFGAEEEKNFPYLMNLIRAGRIENSEDETEQSPLDILFNSIEELDPNHICVRFYKSATIGAGKTLQSVQITLLSRVQKFELASIADMMKNDELELEKLATEPTVLYCIIPDNDTSYNFIVSLLYIQLFQVLYDLADSVYKGRLPRFVHIIMDEFANVHTPEDFLNILGGCRSRNIGISIILQNLSQLKAKYKDGWENIIGQCDEFLYLGGNESSTHEYVSKMLGKETIDTNTYGRRFGTHGDASANYQFAGRELLTPDEVRMLDYQFAILLVKNALPLIDRKIDVTQWNSAKNTALCGRKDMVYTIPSRAERNALPVQAVERAAEKDVFEATATGTETQSINMEFFINGRRVSISSSMIAELLEQYTIDPVELENYLS